MFNYQVLVKFIKNPYAWGFVIFWVLMLVACFTMWILDDHKNNKREKIERSLFWLFGIAMLLFVIFRPIGIARDDSGYLEYYKTICPTFICDQWIQGTRDQGWFSLVGILKSLFQDPKVMLFLGAVGLLVKLMVIYRLVERPLIVLLLYCGLYYQVQDLTAWRVSLAIAFFMLTIWFVVRTKGYWCAWIFILCGFFHKQAFLAPLVIVGALLRQHRKLIILICMVPTVLLTLGIYPLLHLMTFKMVAGFREIALNQGLDTYIAAKLAGVYTGWRHAPTVVYPQILLTLWLVIKAPPKNEKLDTMMVGCLVVSCLFLWAFASLPDAQVRFFEFFMVPTVLLVGGRRLYGFEFTAVVLLSGLLLSKYNFVHHLILQP